eukprot:TRINITY_DN19441_c0_g1_i1.p1 TRINITY_DN19441_c0_g1~~TRINITY_DN19441_c0_g1_i1.p1  ORF type:complete len:444 (+),score=49.37 TRINITY_DN19441_c0_g1_i1:131-1462(+)
MAAAKHHTKDGRSSDGIAETAPYYDDEMRRLSQPETATATSGQLTLNLIIGGLGTGILSLPWSTAGASLIPAIVIMAMVLTLNAWTISIIVEAADRHQVFDLGGILGCLPGSLALPMQIGCNVCVWFSMFLCLVGYIMVAADCMQAVLVLPGISHRNAFVIFSAFCVLPLCFCEQRHLSFTSLLGVFIFANVAACIFAHMVEQERASIQPRVCIFGISWGSVAMISAMMQAVIVQMCVLPMYAEMKDRTPAKFNRVVRVSFATLFLIFTMFAVSGYMAFGPHSQSNILLSLPLTPWGKFSRLAFAFGVLTVYPIMLSPMIAPLRNSSSPLPAGVNPRVAVSAVTLLVIAASTVIAFFVTDLGVLNVVNGAMSCGAFVSVVPGVIGLWLLGVQADNFTWAAMMYVLIAGGVLFSIVGLYCTDNYEPLLTASCQWFSSGLVTISS